MTMTAHSTPFNIATHNGIITMRNPATGEHRTISIATSRHTGDRLVQLLTGCDNERDYKSFARIVDGECKVFWALRDSEFYNAIANILNHPERFVGRLEFMLEGKCRKCNRRLTNPESIESGIGPECRKVER